MDRRGDGSERLLLRGVSQTVTEPALQADLAVEHASGWFGRLLRRRWPLPSSRTRTSAPSELAAQVGYGHALGRGWTAVGTAGRYAYPNAETGHDYLELGVGLNYRASRRASGGRG